MRTNIFAGDRVVPKSGDTHRHKHLWVGLGAFFVQYGFLYFSIKGYLLILSHWTLGEFSAHPNICNFLYLPTICGYPLASSYSLETANSFDIAVISTGHYLFIETSSFWGKGSKAWFIGPRISPQAGKCFQFWYHMYGSSIGELNVYLLTSKTVPSIPTWSRQKNQGNQWYIAQVSITLNHYVNVS